MRSMQPFFPAWIPEAIIMALLVVGCVIILLFMFVLMLDAIIVRSDTRREKRERQNRS